jgi:hypothetical protein
MGEKLKADKREAKRRKKRYGHFGMGASHTRESSKEEMEQHLRGIKGKKAWKNREKKR